MYFKQPDQVSRFRNVLSCCYDQESWCSMHSVLWEITQFHLFGPNFISTPKRTDTLFLSVFLFIVHPLQNESIKALIWWMWPRLPQSPFFPQVDCPWSSIGNDPNQFISYVAFFWDVWYNSYPVDKYFKISAGTETIDISICIGSYLETLYKNWEELDKYFGTSVLRRHGHICSNQSCPWLSPLEISTDCSY